MTKISPMGVYLLLITVRGWNFSSDASQKNKVKDLIFSDKVAETRRVAYSLKKMATSGFYRMDTPINYLANFIADDSTSSLSDMEELAYKEVVSYFISMFKAGHLEQLPMPEFGYEVPQSTENIVHVSERNNELNTLAYEKDKATPPHMRGAWVGTP
jgi:hypothetical protein